MTGHEKVRALVAGQERWQEHGSANHLRYVQAAASTRRRRCGCGCGLRVTYLGMANGVALTSGCELSMRRWAR